MATGSFFGGLAQGFAQGQAMGFRRNLMNMQLTQMANAAKLHQQQADVNTALKLISTGSDMMTKGKSSAARVSGLNFMKQGTALAANYYPQLGDPASIKGLDITNLGNHPAMNAFAKEASKLINDHKNGIINDNSLLNGYAKAIDDLKQNMSLSAGEEKSYEQQAQDEINRQHQQYSGQLQNYLLTAPESELGAINQNGLTGRQIVEDKLREYNPKGYTNYQTTLAQRTAQVLKNQQLLNSMMPTSVEKNWFMTEARRQGINLSTMDGINKMWQYASTSQGKASLHKFLHENKAAVTINNMGDKQPTYDALSPSDKQSIDSWVNWVHSRKATPTQALSALKTMGYNKDSAFQERYAELYSNDNWIEQGARASYYSNPTTQNLLNRTTSLIEKGGTFDQMIAAAKAANLPAGTPINRVTGLWKIATGDSVRQLLNAVNSVGSDEIQQIFGSKQGGVEFLKLAQSLTNPNLSVGQYVNTVNELKKLVYIRMRSNVEGTPLQSKWDALSGDFKGTLAGNSAKELAPGISAGWK